MHALMSNIFTLLLTLSTAFAADYSPFLSPHLAESFQVAADSNGHLVRRNGNCPKDYSSCENLGEPKCCKKKSRCAIDEGGHVACCPDRAVCTGTIAAGTPVTTMPPSQAVPTVPGKAARITGGPSTVPNAFYPFVALPTTFPNAAVCSSSFTSCRTEFAKCTSSLQGGNGVTVGGGGGIIGGVTRLAATLPGEAVSICSSLSTAACSHLALSNCPAYGTAAASAGFSVQTGAAVRCGAAYAVGAGVAVGLAGQIMGA